MPAPPVKRAVITLERISDGARASQEEPDYGGLLHAWTEGNYSCDCNRSLFFARWRKERVIEAECGDDVAFRLVSIAIDGQLVDLALPPLNPLIILP